MKASLLSDAETFAPENPRKPEDRPHHVRKIVKDEEINDEKFEEKQLEKIKGLIEAL